MRTSSRCLLEVEKKNEVFRIPFQKKFNAWHCFLDSVSRHVADNHANSLAATLSMFVRTDSYL